MWKTFVAEIKHFLSSKWKIIGFILMLFIPFVYGFFYMNAYWSPFKHVDQLKIAIVSRDVNQNNKPTATSQKFINSLVKNKNLSVSNQIYNVVNDQSLLNQPEVGVNNGKYAAIVIVPRGYETSIQSLDFINLALNPKTIGDAFLKSLNYIKQNDHTYDRITFYNSYKHNYLAGEMTNFVAAANKLAISALIPDIVDLKHKNTILKNFNTAQITNKMFNVEKTAPNIDTYGKGLSPYFISIALWAGALVMTFIIKNKRYVKTENTFKHYFGKSMVWVFSGWIQSLILITALYIQGIRSEDGIWNIYLFAIFTSTIFTLIAQALSYTMRYGDLGEFLVVVLLIMQLISSSGTFPVEMQSAIFKVIHPIAPFTYSINGIRELMWNTNISSLFSNIGWLMLFPILLIPISLGINYHFDKKTFKQNKKYSSFEIHLDEY